MKAKKNAFIGYLEVLKKKYSSLNKLSPDGQFIVDSFFKKVLDKMPHGVAILDYRTAKYIYISENVAEVFTGLKNDILLEQGAQFWHTLMNDDDRFIIHDKIFPKMLSVMHTIPYDTVSNYKFSYNYRISHKSGRIIKILQNLVVLEADENNNPLLGLITVTDITPYKTNNSVIFTVTYPGKKKGEFIPHYESFNMSLEKPANISVRENEVIAAIANGFSTAQIAEKLRISVYTVNAHRRNIFEKTGVKNVAELINYATSNGLV